MAELCRGGGIPAREQGRGGIGEHRWRVWKLLGGSVLEDGGRRSELHGSRATTAMGAAAQLSATRARPAACERVVSGTERHTASSARGRGDHGGRRHKVRAGVWQAARVRERGEGVSEKDTTLWKI